MSRPVTDSTSLQLPAPAVGVLALVLASLTLVALVCIGVTAARVTADPGPVAAPLAGR